MTDNLRALPPTFVRDWFTHDIGQEVEQDRPQVGDAKSDLILNLLGLVLDHLRKFMAANDIVFAVSAPEPEGD